MNDDDKTAQRLDAVAKILEAMPIYDDALKPIAQEAGKALGTVGRAVNIALAPLRGVVWGAEQIEAWLQNSVDIKLENVPKEQIVTPKLSIAGPAIEALKYAADEPHLSDIFAGLLASAMIREKRNTVHPSYLEITKQLTSDEARILKFMAESGTQVYIQIIETDPIRKRTRTLFTRISELPARAGCENISEFPIYLDNLVRLGLIKFNDDAQTGDDKEDIARLVSSPPVLDYLAQQGERGNVGSTLSGFLNFTSLGDSFVEAAIR